jgi:hypothetical protein
MNVSVERRGAARIDKVFRVLLSTEETGDQWYVGRNISATGMFVEMSDPLPLRSKVIVRFQAVDEGSPWPQARRADPSICAMAKVQNHYYLQYSDGEGLRAMSGVGLKFVRFLPEAGASLPADCLH